jgi:hypothetical protein
MAQPPRSQTLLWRQYERDERDLPDGYRNVEQVKGMLHDALD